MSSTPFRVDILDSSGNVLGGGPLTHVTQLDTTDRLDSIGEASFSMPAADPRGALINAGVEFDLYDRDDGYLGRYLYKSKSVEQRPAGAIMTVHLYDALRELSRYTVGFRRTYVYMDVAAVIADLVAEAPGWSATVEAAIGNTTVSYEGESILMAVDELRDRWGRHYRAGAGQVLEFGAFGTPSGVRLTNLRGQVQVDYRQRGNVAIVETIRLEEESDEIFNSLIPLGAGQGVSQLTIETATLGDYAVQTGTNTDGSHFYYIQDAASVALYGERWKVLTFPNIRPITNSDANILNAVNAVKLTAETYIGRHTAPRVTYAVTVRGLQEDVRVGDTVRLAYKGLVDGYSFIDVDEDFYVMDISRTRSAGGMRAATLNISTAADRRTADTDVLVDVLNDMRALKVHVPITLAYNTNGPYRQRIDSTVDATYRIRIREEVTALNRALLRFQTSPLKSSVASTATAAAAVETSSAGGDHRHKMFDYHSQDTGGHSSNTYYQGATDGVGSSYVILSLYSSAYIDVYTYDASGSHDHDVTLPAHSHDMSYGIYEDNQYPRNISVSIDGIDRTAALGGPWAATNASAELELDITDYLVNAVGGVRQIHSIVFSCTAGRGEIEAEVQMLVSIQAIAVTA